MPKTAWPTMADLNQFAKAEDLPEGFDFEAAVEAAIDKAEDISGRSPLLADEDDSENLYDPNPGYSGRCILSTHDFVSITTVHTHWDGSEGSLLEATKDYLTEPRKRDRGWPIEGFEFRHGAGSEPDSVRIVGRRGTFTALPIDLWEAVGKLAAAKGLNANAPSQGAVRRKKQGEREIEYAATQTAGIVSNLAKGYEDEALATFARYVKVSVDG